MSRVSFHVVHLLCSVLSTLNRPHTTFDTTYGLARLRLGQQLSTARTSYERVVAQLIEATRPLRLYILRFTGLPLDQTTRKCDAAEFSTKNLTLVFPNSSWVCVYVWPGLSDVSALLVLLKPRTYHSSCTRHHNHTR